MFSAINRGIELVILSVGLVITISIIMFHMYVYHILKEMSSATSSLKPILLK